MNVALGWLIIFAGSSMHAVLGVMGLEGFCRYRSKGPGMAGDRNVEDYPDLHCIRKIP